MKNTTSFVGHRALSISLLLSLASILPFVHAQDGDFDGIPDASDPYPTINAVVADPDGPNNLPASLSTGLTGRWDCESLTSFGGTTHGFVDLAGNDQPLKHASLGLTLDNAGMISKAVRFDADSDYLSAPGSLVSGLSSFSVSMWIKLDANYIQNKAGGINTTLFAFNSALDAYPDFGLMAYKGVAGSPTQKLSFVRYVGTNTSIAWTAEVPQADWIDDGRWRHLSMIKNGNNFRVFLDGVKISDVNATTGSWTTTATGYFCFGKSIPNATNNGNTFHGSMDRLRFYSRALTDAETTALYTQDSDRDGFYDLEEKELEGGAVSPFYNRGPGEDSDGDGLPDQWERDYGLNPLSATGSQGGNGDADGDGVSNFLEYRNGTNPNVADSDGDGKSDAIEIAQGSNPNSAADHGNSPPDPVVDVPFLIGGDYTTWEMEIKAMGPRDEGRTIKVVSPTFANEVAQPVTLWKNNKYEITVKYLRTIPGVEDKWYCWQAQVDGKPTSQTFVQEPDYQVGARTAGAKSILLANHWLVDNREGLLTAHIHSKGTNHAGSKKATLIPVSFKTYPDSEPGPGKAHQRNLPHLANSPYGSEWRKCVAQQWETSHLLKMSDFLEGVEDSGLQTLLDDSLEWKIDGADVSSATIDYGSEPNEHQHKHRYIEAKPKGGGDTLDRLIVTVIPRSTKVKFDNWYSANAADLSWLAELPPMFLQLETTPGPDGYLPRPDRNFNPFLYGVPHTIDSWYHAGSSYEQRSYATPGNHGHQVCFDAGGALITTGFGAGSADKQAPFPAQLDGTLHREQDVKPFIWALQLDGNPSEGGGSPEYTELTAPMLYGGSYLEKYFQVRPTVANAKPKLLPGATP